ncbi:DNA-binding transcriptional regulator, IclR family [Bartonella apihabitans]|uniref:IclR family transcriptional regulator n=1 Tax=Bartonella apihabitans TaxID=2750929 RepID=UPI00098F85A4|nr:IclR family transcriptional regulator [Bartonella apihabitans]AQT44974.1 DNA-binding transcriptional regulator, IclR family [Bartonella apihabitans]
MRTVPALDRGLRILEFLASQPKPVRVTKLIEELGIPRSAMYELLNTLSQHRMVIQSNAGEFSLGPANMMLGGAYQSRIDFDVIAGEIARKLEQEVDETVQVGRLDGRFVFYVAKAESSQRVRLISSIGARLPAHCTALGKILLAYLPENIFETLFRDIVLEQLTNRSINDLSILRQQLNTVRNEDIAFETGESNIDVYCMATPVRNSEGKVIAAISISLPLSRAVESHLHQLQNAIRKAGMEFSCRLGWAVARQDHT